MDSRIIDKVIKLTQILNNNASNFEAIKCGFVRELSKPYSYTRSRIYALRSDFHKRLINGALGTLEATMIVRFEPILLNYQDPEQNQNRVCCASAKLAAAFGKFIEVYKSESSEKLAKCLVGSQPNAWSLNRYIMELQKILLELGYYQAELNDLCCN
jgi:hypothetical protein